MTFKKIILLLSAGAMLYSVNSCNKDDEDTTKSYLSGSITMTMPAFVAPGDVYDFELTGCTTSSGGSVGYFWTDPISGDNDTLRLESDPASVKAEFTYVVPDTLLNLSLTGAAFADGYYNSSTSVSFSIVDPSLDGDGSITGFEKYADDGIFVDPRDNTEYRTVTINKKEWMRRNLQWEGSGYPYYDSKATVPLFGEFYTWEQAQTACPDGWHLPTDAEWVDLCKALGYEGKIYESIEGVAGELMDYEKFNGESFWEFWPAVKVTDNSRLSVISCGLGALSDGKAAFSGISSYAMFWTADEYQGMGTSRYIYVDKPILYFGINSKTETLASVRCVR